MENKTETQQEIENEMLELNEQFSAFLHTKGIAAKFKLAFHNMSESTKQQHAADVAEFEAVKAKSAEDNKEFAEFLRHLLRQGLYPHRLRAGRHTDGKMGACRQ